MQINTLSSRYVGLPTVHQGSETAEPIQSSPAETAAAEPNSPGTSSAFRQILAQYDVSSTTPRQFSEMLQKLRQSGAISDQQYQNLSQIRTDLDASGVQPDQEVDLVKFYSQKVNAAPNAAAAAQTQTGSSPAGSSQTLSTAQQRLDWLRKVSTIQNDPNAGINSLA
jgi:tryptophan 2,3-dioxygenase